MAIFHTCDCWSVPRLGDENPDASRICDSRPCPFCDSHNARDSLSKCGKESREMEQSSLNPLSRPAVEILGAPVLGRKSRLRQNEQMGPCVREVWIF